MDKFLIKRPLLNPQNELAFFDFSDFFIAVIYFRGLAVNRENNMSAEISCFTVLCLKNNITKYEFGGPFKSVKTCPKWAKSHIFAHQTYFLEYLRLERSPAARRCACVYIVLFVTCSLVAYVSIFYLNGSKYLFTLLS